MVSAPLITLCHDRTFVAGSFRQALRERRWFYGGLAATWLLLAVLVLSTGNRGGSAGFGLEVTPWTYLLTQCKAIVHYLRLSLWPHPLVLDYGDGVEASLAKVWPQAAGLTLLFIASLVMFWRRMPAGFLGLAFFAVLAPSSSIVPVVTQTMAEHRMYLPLVCVVTMLTGAIYRWLGRRSLWLLPFVAVALGYGTERRNEDYRSALSIWGSTRGNTRNARADAHYATALYDAGRFAEAAPIFRQALREEPDDVDANHNFANTLVATGHYAEAAEHYQFVLRHDPKRAETYFGLGNALSKQRQWAQAIDCYRTAIALKPGLAEARNNLGGLLAGFGRLKEAEVQFAEAARLVPANRSFLINLARVRAEIARRESHQ